MESFIAKKFNSIKTDLKLFVFADNSQLNMYIHSSNAANYWPGDNYVDITRTNQGCYLNWFINSNYVVFHTLVPVVFNMLQIEGGKNCEFRV